MDWYRVIKTINGRLYDYWQRTERHGRSVKTFNKYIGPSGAMRERYAVMREYVIRQSTTDPKPFLVVVNGKPLHFNTAEEAAKFIQRRTSADGYEITEQQALDQTISALPHHTSAMEKLNPYHGLDAEWRAKVQKVHAKTRAGDERIQYGNLKDRIKRNQLTVRAAKKLTRHFKPLNHFAAKIALHKKK